MTEHCVIQADFSATRIIAGRKCLQLIFEVPIEAADDAMAKLGGFPQPGENRWVAIALLDTKLVREAATPQITHTNGEREVSGSASTPQAEGGSPKKWSEYPRSQQAAILCGDHDFWVYCQALDADHAAKMLRRNFNIQSRRELDQLKNHARWDEFVALYNLHREARR